MKTEEDEAFDELAKRQGAWGGGFKAKQAMAADKLQEDLLNYGTAWSQDGKRIDPMSVYKEQPAQEPWNEDEWRRNNWRCGHGWLRGEQCEICNAAQPAQEPVCDKDPQGCWNVRCQLGKQCKNLVQPAQEPVGWADLQKKAQQIVESKFLWKRFIDGTPLANDIACWMADFARQYTTPPQRPWVGLTDEEIDAFYLQHHNQYDERESLNWGYERAIEAKLKEKNT